MLGGQQRTGEQSFDIIEVRERENIGEGQRCPFPEPDSAGIRVEETHQRIQALGKLVFHEGLPLLFEVWAPEGGAQMVLGVAESLDSDVTAEALGFVLSDQVSTASRSRLAMRSACSAVILIQAPSSAYSIRSGQTML